MFHGISPSFSIVIVTEIIPIVIVTEIIPIKEVRFHAAPFRS